MGSPHFVLFPFMAQGHMIPMIDLAKLLAHQGAIITIFTTPHNAARNHSVVTRAVDSGLQIRVVELQFPCSESGLPQGCENLDLLPSLSTSSTFFKATCLLLDPSDQIFPTLSPSPTAIISDMCLPWTLTLARKHRVPRLVLYSLSCFFFLCVHNLTNQRPLLSSISDSDVVTFSDLPHPVQFRKSQLPKATNEEMAKFSYQMAEADRQSHGFIINTFEEMEPEYVALYRNQRESPERVWCVGPVSLWNIDNQLDVAQRGNKAAIDEHECINWLDGQRSSSVVYVSLGSLCNLGTAQLIELGLGLEASDKPFIWVIRKENMTGELKKWMEEYDFEGKVKGRGLVIRGWSPQVMILSHPAIGCFLTHCGWNSSIEGMSAGVPMITWPLFADQVFNDKLIVEVLGIGVSVGVETALPWGEEEERGVLVKRERVREAIEIVMDGDGREEMRERCKQLAEKANRAVQEGGSSQINLKLLMEDIVVHGRSCENGSCS